MNPFDARHNHFVFHAFPVAMSRTSSQQVGFQPIGQTLTFCTTDTWLRFCTACFLVVHNQYTRATLQIGTSIFTKALPIIGPPPITLSGIFRQTSAASISWLHRSFHTGQEVRRVLQRLTCSPLPHVQTKVYFSVQLLSTAMTQYPRSEPLHHHY